MIHYSHTDIFLFSIILITMLQHTTLYVALGIPYIDSVYPYIVHQPPSQPITTRSHVTIIVSDIPDALPCTAQIKRVNRIGLGYVIFDIFHCQYDIRQVAIPLEWVHLSRIERIYHWRGLSSSRGFHGRFLQGILVPDPLPVTSEVIQDGYGDSNEAVEG